MPPILRLRARRVMGAFMLLIAATLRLFGFVPGLLASMPFLVGWVIVDTLTINADSTAAFGLFMTLSNPAVGATQFAVFMAS